MSRQNRFVDYRTDEGMGNIVVAVIAQKGANNGNQERPNRAKC